MSPAAVFLYALYLGLSGSEVPIAGPLDNVECSKIAAEHNKEIKQVAADSVVSLPVWYCGLEF